MCVCVCQRGGGGGGSRMTLAGTGRHAPAALHALVLGHGAPYVGVCAPTARLLTFPERKKKEKGAMKWRAPFGWHDGTTMQQAGISRSVISTLIITIMNKCQAHSGSFVGGDALLSCILATGWSSAMLSETVTPPGANRVTFGAGVSGRLAFVVCAFVAAVAVPPARGVHTGLLRPERETCTGGGESNALSTTAHRSLTPQERLIPVSPRTVRQVCSCTIAESLPAQHRLSAE